MTVVSISSHEVNTVAVFIPEGSLIGQSTVGDSDVIVMVVGGEWTAVVVGHRVACKVTQQRPSIKWTVVLLGYNKHIMGKYTNISIVAVV